MALNVTPGSGATIKTTPDGSGHHVGHVHLDSLPSLPAGANGIGSVGVTSLPVAFNAGAAGATVVRVVMASDSPDVVALQILDDIVESGRAKSNPIVGQAGVAGGSGATSANTLRTTEANDSPLMAAVGQPVASPAADTMLARLKTIGDLLADTSPVNVKTNPSTVKGYTQITSLGTAATLGTPPAGSTRALIQAEAQDVRWRDDGVNPTASVGMVLAAGDSMLYDGDLAAIKFIQVTATAKLNVSFYS